jgi:hypothetical protein
MTIKYDYAHAEATNQAFNATIQAHGQNVEDMQNHAAKLMSMTSGEFRNGMDPKYKAFLQAAAEHHQAMQRLHGAIVDAGQNTYANDKAQAAKYV